MRFSKESSGLPPLTKESKSFSDSVDQAVSKGSAHTISSQFSVFLCGSLPASLSPSLYFYLSLSACLFSGLASSSRIPSPRCPTLLWVYIFTCCSLPQGWGMNPGLVIDHWAVSKALLSPWNTLHLPDMLGTKPRTLYRSAKPSTPAYLWP